MAYSGTTAASSLVNVPVLLARGLGRITSTLGVIGATGLSGDVQGGTGLWTYTTFDSQANILTAGYFTDGKQLGMRVGDIIINLISGTSYGTTPTSVLVGALVTTNSTAGFNVAPGLAIASS